ncbi:serine hydrolase, partial [bacterium]|nr:serine hydrolase [candidate division CSSED10-310 bacterium]
RLFTVIAILQLADAGKLKLNDPLNTIFPDFPEPMGSKITLHHLLLETSGIKQTVNYPESAFASPNLSGHLNILPSLTKSELLWEPGTHLTQGDANYLLLGAVIEKIHGKPYFTVIKETIWDPLAMTHTSTTRDTAHTDPVTGYSSYGIKKTHSYRVSDIPANALGGVVSNIQDVWRFTDALNSGKLISRKSLLLLYNHHFRENGYSLRFMDPEKTYCEKKTISVLGAGNGFYASFSYIPDDDITILILSNLDSTDPSLISGIESILCGKPYTIPRQTTTDLIFADMVERTPEVTVKSLPLLVDSGNWILQDEETLDTVGYALIEENLIDLAISVFRLNADKFPDVPAVYLSLAEAYRLHGEKEKAMEVSRKVMELDPEDPGAVRKLKDH